MRNAFVKKLSELAASDPRICLATGDLGFGVLTDFAEKLPRQYLNVGVAEQNLTGIATGLALEGRIVFTYSIANFPTFRCLEQIRNDACYHEANVKIVAIGGGFSYGALGMSHHATEDLAVLRALPNMLVVAPGDVWEAEQATVALAGVPGTAYLRLDKSAAPPTAAPDESFTLGKARIVRAGSDLSLICCGGILGVVMEAASKLAKNGLYCRIVSMHTVKPIDQAAILDACRKTGGIITVEEHSIDGGLGSAVAETCMDAGIAPRIFHRMGLRAGFSSIVGSQDYLRRAYGLDCAAIVGTAMRALAGQSPPCTGSRKLI